jgi:hypothetical protein
MISIAHMHLPPRPVRRVETKLVTLLDHCSEQLLPELLYNYTYTPVKPAIFTSGVEGGDQHQPERFTLDWTSQFVIALKGAEHSLVDAAADLLVYELGEPVVNDSDEVIEPMMTLSTSPVAVTAHRRIRPGKKVSVIQELVTDCKIKFGRCADNAANRKMIHRFCVNSCERHGMRTTHIRCVVATVVELVLTPDCWELEARQLASSREVRTRRGERLSLWHRFLNFIEGASLAPPVPEI